MNSDDSIVPGKKKKTPKEQFEEILASDLSDYKKKQRIFELKSKLVYIKKRDDK